MFANVIGRVDPKTGEMKEYPVKTPESGPHGLEFDKDGNVWFTANSEGLHRQARSEDRRHHRIQAAGRCARSAHAAVRAERHAVLHRSEREHVGRLNPKTGEIKVQKTPTERANPYGMVFTTKGVPFVCDFGTNKIIEIDPDTLAIKEYPLPNAESRPRRIAISPDDIIWYADYSRGYLGRLDPKTGQVTRMAVAERTEVAAVRNHVSGRRDLVRRVGDQAERARAVRHQDAEVPELDHSGRRRRRPQHEDDRRWRNIVMAESGVNKIAPRRDRRAGRLSLTPGGPYSGRQRVETQTTSERRLQLF